MVGRILSGGKSTFPKVTQGMGEFFFDQAVKYAENAFQIDAANGKEESFASAKQRSTRLTMSLKKIGLAPSDVVVTCLGIHMNTAIPHLGILFTGAIFAALDPIQSEQDWVHCINIVAPKIIFVDQEHLLRMEQCVEKTKVKPDLIVVGESLVYKTFSELSQPAQDEESFRPESGIDCHETAVIIFSSRTTGWPKAMCLSHYSIINAALNYLHMDICDPAVNLIYSSFYWITSVMTLTRLFCSGGCRVLVKHFQPKEALDVIERFKITHILTASSITKQIIRVDDAEKYETSCLYHYATSGTMITPEDLKKARKIFAKSFVTNQYGNSEAPGLITCFDLTRDKHLLHKLKSVGKCMVDVEIKIVDESSKEVLGPYQEGEILLRSPYCMKRYYKADASSRFDADGFLKTGDKGYYDEDDCIYIVGRCDEIFKYGVVKVVPAQWEMVLEQHPAIQEAGVIGIVEDSVGFRPAACVVLKKGVSATVEEIQDFFVGKMGAHHGLVGGVKFVESLPKTPSSKLQRCKLLQLFMDAPN